MLPIDAQQIRAAEILFQPSMIGVEGDGLSSCIRSSISKCASNEQLSVDEMFSHILLTGGSSRFKGLSDRLKKELDGFPELGSVEVCSNVDRYKTWTGGAEYTTHLNNNNKWITIAEYEEYGSSIVLTKC